MSDSVSSSLYLTNPEAAIRLRRLQQARALQTQSTQNVRSHMQGAALLANALLGAWDEYDVRREMKAEREAQNARTASILTGLGIAPSGGAAAEQPAMVGASEPPPQATAPSPQTSAPPPTSPPPAAAPNPIASADLSPEAIRAENQRMAAERERIMRDEPPERQPQLLAAVSGQVAAGRGLPAGPAYGGTRSTSEMPGWDRGLPAPTGAVPAIGGAPAPTPAPQPPPASPAAPPVPAGPPAPLAGMDPRRMVQAGIALSTSGNPADQQLGRTLMAAAQALHREQAPPRTVQVVGPQGPGVYEQAPNGGLGRFLGGIPQGPAGVAPGTVLYDPNTRQPLFTNPAQPMGLAPNTTLYNPNTNQPLYTAPPAPEPGFQPAPGGGSMPIPGGSRDPRQIAAERAAQTEGTTQGERAAAAPGTIATADQTLAQIEGVLSHPGLRAGTGMTSFTTAIPGTPMHDFGQRVEQLRGKAFLEAFNQLRGGGQISNAEGSKAEAAIARLRTSQSTTEFRTALEELRGIVQAARERARTNAGGTPIGTSGMAADPPAGNRPPLTSFQR